MSFIFTIVGQWDSCPSTKSLKKLDDVSSQHDVDERITGVTEISWTFVTIMGHFSQCWDFWLQKCHKSVKWDSGTAVPLKKIEKKNFHHD